MGASRTSNKDILAAIMAQTDAIGRLTDAITGGAMAPVAAPSPTGTVAENGSEATSSPAAAAPSTVKVDPEYLSNQTQNAQKHADKHDTVVLMYVRRNLQGQVKIGYCVEPNWDGGKSPVNRRNGTIGLIGEPIRPRS